MINKRNYGAARSRRYTGGVPFEIGVEMEGGFGQEYDVAGNHGADRNQGNWRSERTEVSVP